MERLSLMNECYKEAMKSCDCKEWVRIINTVLKRKEERLAQGRKMSACDERYLKRVCLMRT